MKHPINIICKDIYGTMVSNCPMHPDLSFAYDLKTIPIMIPYYKFVISQYMNKLPEHPKVWK